MCKPRELGPLDVPHYVLAGNATVTLVSGETNNRFTYKIKRHENKPELYFVNLLHGPDNESDYRYVGCYYSDTHEFHPVKTYRDRPNFTWPPSMRAINFLFARLYTKPDNFHVYHEGRCGRCGRKLTTPESIERGLGPECFERSNYERFL